jgi:hypothetical protein
MWTDGLTDRQTDMTKQKFASAIFRIRPKERKSIILSAVFVDLEIEFLLYGDDNSLRVFFFVVWNT